MGGKGKKKVKYSYVLWCLLRNLSLFFYYFVLCIWNLNSLMDEKNDVNGFKGVFCILCFLCIWSTQNVSPAQQNPKNRAPHTAMPNPLFASAKHATLPFAFDSNTPAPRRLKNTNVGHTEKVFPIELPNTAWVANELSKNTQKEGFASSL